MPREKKKINMAEIMPAPVDEAPKTRKTRVSNKPSYDQLKQKLEATEHLLEATQQRLEQTTNAMNAMAADYTRITNYVMKSLNVFYESTIMAFKEDKK